jgi:hypothetical protein
MQSVRRTQLRIKAANVGIGQPAVVRVQLGCVGLAGSPGVEVGQSLLRFCDLQHAYPDQPGQCGGNLGGCKITDGQIVAAAKWERANDLGEPFIDNYWNDNADVEIQAHLSSSSYIWLSSKTDVIPTLLRAWVRANSHSSMALEDLAFRGALERNSATGLPCRAITTSSPSIALPIRTDSRFFASATL